MRIVSLVPAATEIVWALGLGDDLVGISHGCDFPPSVVGRPVVIRPARAGAVPAPGGLPAPDGPPAPASGPPRAQVDVALLASLRPDVVLAGPWEAATVPGTAWAVRDAVGADATVVTLEPTSLEGIFHAIATVGAMTEAEDEAVGLVEILRERLADLEEVVAERHDERRRAPRVVALDWLDPPASAGLWIPEQIRRAGGWELLAGDGDPGAPTSWEAIGEVDPEMLLLLPRGMHLAEAVGAWRSAPRPRGWDELQAVRRGHVVALDAAAYFDRPGPRVIDGIEILAEIFDPEAFVDLAPAGSWVPVS
jgi:iron complex transport system substrate-binding protein